MKATASSRPAAAVAATALVPNLAVIQVMTLFPTGIRIMPMVAGTAKRMILLHAARTTRPVKE